jgi:hypothetical protein
MSEQEVDPRTLAKDPGGQPLTDYREAQRLCDEAWPKIVSEIESAGVVLSNPITDSALDTNGNVILRTPNGKTYQGVQPSKFGVMVAEPTPDKLRTALAGFGRVIVEEAKKSSATVAFVRSALMASDDDSLREGLSCFVRLRLVLTREVRDQYSP